MLIEEAPFLIRYFDSIYKFPNNAICNSNSTNPIILPIHTGVIQGGPILGFLLELTINHFLNNSEYIKHKSHLDLFYHDDGYIMGKPNIVRQKINILKKTMYNIGITLNKSKTKLFIGKDAPFSSWMKDFDVSPSFNTTILGYNLGTQQFLDKKLEEACLNLKENLVQTKIT